MSKRMYHPCHKLSVPSAKIFWCRHCMQMFEDAISRWRHSRTCKGSAKVNREKDLNGQVIQLYVKPDKVSYRDNIIPGQHIVNYKPHVKKNSAELKCLICQSRFLSLDDIREHVKYPCRRSNSNRLPESAECEAVGSDLDDIEDPTLIKIRRVEHTQNSEPVPASGTGLSVLAEASKHIESLLSYNNSLQNNLGRHLNDSGLQPVTVIPELSSLPLGEELVVESKGLTTLPYSFGINSSSEEKGRAEPPPLVKHQTGSEVNPKPVEPTVIVFQQEDCQALPAEFIGSEAVQHYIKETAASLPAGQVLQVQLGENFVQNYITTNAGGEVLPVEVIPSIKLTPEAEGVQNNSSGSGLVNSQRIQPTEVASGIKSYQPDLIQKTIAAIPNLTRPSQAPTPGAAQNTSVSALLRSALSLPQNTLLEVRENSEVPPLQTSVAALHNLDTSNLDYTGQVSQSVEITAVPKQEVSVLEETVEEHGYFLPSEQEVLL